MQFPAPQRLRHFVKAVIRILVYHLIHVRKRDLLRGRRIGDQLLCLAHDARHIPQAIEHDALTAFCVRCDPCTAEGQIDPAQHCLLVRLGTIHPCDVRRFAQICPLALGRRRIDDKKNRRRLRIFKILAQILFEISFGGIKICHLDDALFAHERETFRRRNERRHSASLERFPLKYRIVQRRLAEKLLLQHRLSALFEIFLSPRQRDRWAVHPLPDSS